MDVVSLSKSLYKSLREREQDLMGALAAGLPSGWDQYQHMVGELRGLSYAKEELKALLEKTSEDVEETLSS
jgi:hypothetical protein